MKKLLSLYILLIGIGLQAQQVQDSVKTEVINVTRSFEPKEVQDAYKLDVNPDIDKVTEQKIPVNFRIQSVPVASTFTPEKGGMANFQAGSITEDVYQSYASLAIGNYTQIQADTYVYYPVTDKLGSAFRLSHYSSQGGENDDIKYDPFYHTFADILFDYKSDKSLWNVDLGYNGHINYLKDNLTFMPLVPVVINTYQHKENNFVLKADGDFNDLFIKDFSFDYNNYWDDFDNSEHRFHLFGNFKFPIRGIDVKLGVQTDLVSGNLGRVDFIADEPQQELTYTNTDFGVLPAVQIENENLVINVGAKIFYQNQDTIYNAIQVIPDVKLNFNLIFEKLTVFAGATGDLQQNSQAALSLKNPYLRPDNLIIPTLTPYDIFGGFNGAFSSSFSYEVKLGAKKTKNYPFYNFKGNALAEYEIFYDDMLQSYFETSFNIGIGKKFDLKLDMTYLQNDPDHLKKALFIPDFTFKSIMIFRPSEKLNFNATLHSLGNRYFQAGNDDYISSFTDLNLGIRYNINRQFTAFIQGNNLLGNAYEIYYNYPVQKVQILLGATYRFDIPKIN